MLLKYQYLLVSTHSSCGVQYLCVSPCKGGVKKTFPLEATGRIGSDGEAEYAADTAQVDG